MDDTQKITQIQLSIPRNKGGAMNMLAVKSGVNSRLIECRKNRDCFAIYDLLEPILRDGSGAELGVAKMELAITEFAQSEANAPQSIKHVNEALPLLESDPWNMCRALVHGMYCARYMEDLGRSKAFVGIAKDICAAPNTEAEQWLGRLWTWIGYYKQDTGKLEVACQYFEKAARFYETNEGPFNEHDRYCQHRIALTALADAQWAMGRRLEAVANMRRAKDLPGDGGAATILYLEGRIKFSEGIYEEAVHKLNDALPGLKDMNDHAAVLRATETLAEAYAALGQTDGVRDLLRSHMVSAAQARMVPVLIRLQELAYGRPHKAKS